MEINHSTVRGMPRRELEQFVRGRSPIKQSPILDPETGLLGMQLLETPAGIAYRELSRRDHTILGILRRKLGGIIKNLLQH